MLREKQKDPGVAANELSGYSMSWKWNEPLTKSAGDKNDWGFEDLNFMAIPRNEHPPWRWLYVTKRPADINSVCVERFSNSVPAC